MNHEALGLTKVEHLDILIAVENYKTAKRRYEFYQVRATEWAEAYYKSLPWHKKLTTQLKGLDFIFLFPVKSWYGTYGEIFNTCREGFGEKYLKLFNLRDYFSYYVNNKVITADQCINHSKIYDDHYLTPEQVKFVALFKDFY